MPMPDAEDVRSTLLERGADCDAVAAHLAAAGTGGAPGVLLVEGAAGVGKSSVLAAAARPDGVAVAAVRARSGDLGLPHAALLEALERLGAPLPPPPDSADAGGDPARRLAERRREVVAALGARAAASPVALALDDLHWADDATLEVLVRLAEEPVAGLAVVAATRPDVEPARLQLATRLRTAAQVRRLLPLSAASSRELLAVRLGRDVPPDEAADVHAGTGGNPFLLGEAALALRSGSATAPARGPHALPPDVARRIVGRTISLGTPAEALALAVAVLGPQATLVRAAALTGLPVEEAARHADALAAAEVLAAGAELALAHPLVGDALLAAAGAHRLGRLRRAAALALVAEGEPAPTAAALLRAAPPAADPEVVDVLRRAAAGLVAAGAVEPAAALLARAVAEPPPVEQRAGTLLELGAARAAQGLAHDAERAYEEARASAPAELLPAAHAGLAGAQLAQGRFAEAGASARAAVALLAADDATARTRDLRARATLVLSFVAAPEESAAVAASLERPLAPATREERRLLAQAAVAVALGRAAPRSGCGSSPAGRSTTAASSVTRSWAPRCSRS